MDAVGEPPVVVVVVHQHPGMERNQEKRGSLAKICSKPPFPARVRIPGTGNGRRSAKPPSARTKSWGTFFKNHGITSHTGDYRFTFGLEKYFEAMGVTPVFLEAVVVFNITDQAHDHIPVEITPYTISTYRGE